MSVYADTSFLVSSYITDQHSSKADQLLLSHPRILSSPLLLAEWAHAVAQHVFRGHLSPADADRTNLEFEADRLSGLWVEVAMPESAYVRCAELARLHGAKFGMRTLDSLHVACALELKADRFWSFDERQAKLAKAVGLRTN